MLQIYKGKLFKARWSFPENAAWKRLFFAFTVSTAGDQLTRVVLLAKAHEVSNDLKGITIILIVQSLPALFASPLAGVLSDRGDKLRYLLAASLLNAIVIACIAFSTSFSALVVLSALFAVGGAVFRPVEASLETFMLDSSEIPLANGLRVAVRNCLSIIGPAAAAGLLLYFPTTVPLIIDAGTFFIAFVILTTLSEPENDNQLAVDKSTSITSDLMPGIKTIWANMDLRILFYLQIILVLLLGMQGTLFYGFSVDNLHGGGYEFGILMASLSIGSLLGALALIQWPGLIVGPRLIVWVLAIDAVSLLLFTYCEGLVTSCFFMLIMGFISAAFMVVVRTNLQLLPPENLRGRVLGLAEALQAPVMVLSLLIALMIVDIFHADQILRWLAFFEFLAVLPCLYITRAKLKPL